MTYKKNGGFAGHRQESFDADADADGATTLTRGWRRSLYSTPLLRVQRRRLPNKRSPRHGQKDIEDKH
jgi:hypothetical protein